MRLFLRYQTSVQKEYDTAMKEFRKTQAEHAGNSLERAYADMVRDQEPALPEHLRNSEPASVPPVGFASQLSSTNLKHSRERISKQSAAVAGA
jgi:hypothetical protein